MSSKAVINRVALDQDAADAAHRAASTPIRIVEAVLSGKEKA